MSINTWEELSDLANPVFRGLVEMNPHAHYPTGSNWVSEGSNTYSHVCDEVRVTASTDNGQEMTEKATLAEVQAAAGSWWFDVVNQKIYVHCFDNDNLSSTSTDVVVMVFVWKMFSTDDFELPEGAQGIPGSGCKLYVPMIKGSGGTVYDKSGQGNDGTIYEIVWAFSEISGKCLEWTGAINERVDFGDVCKITDDLTVWAWVYPTLAPDGLGRLVITKYFYGGGGAGQRGWNLGVSYGGTDEFNFQVYDSSGTYNTASKSNFFAQNLNKWTFVMGEFKPSQYVRLYVNNVKVAEVTTDVISAIAYGTVPLRLGCRADNTSQGMWHGKIDEARIRNGILTGAEKTAVFNQRGRGIQYMPIVRQDSLPALGLSVDDLVEGMYRFNFGSFKMNNPGWFDKAAEEYLWTNCKTLIKLGGEDLPYNEYCIYFVGRVSDYSVKDEEAAFTVKDVRVGTYAQLPVDHYWVSNYPKLETGAEGLAIPIFYGIKKNIIPVCIDSNRVIEPYGDPPYPAGSKWKIAGSRKIKEFTEIRLNFGDIDYSVPLIENTHYTTDLNNAEFTLLIPLIEGDTLEVDAKGYVVDGGVLMEKGGTIAKNILKTYLGFVDGDLDLPSFDDVDTERPYELCIYLDTDKSSREILQTIGRSVIAFFTPVENGKLAFEIYKSAVPAGTLELFDRDFGDDWKVELIDFFLRNKVKLQYDQNPKTQEFEVVEKNNYDVLYKYGVRETLILETYLREPSDAAAIAQAVQNMCSSPIKIVSTSCGVKAFKLFPTRKVKITRKRAVDSSGAWDAKVFRVREITKDVNTEQTQLVAADDFQLLGDIPHVNIPHTDVPYSHTPHSDTPHANTPHSNSPHTNYPHTDTSHVNTPHTDVPHEDGLTHTHEPHTDEVNGDHEDYPHEDHEDAPHVNTPYSHTPHVNTGHIDNPHEDHLDESTHEDYPHEDEYHENEPHTDGHTDVPHGNTAYSHTPHTDDPYQDVPHGDTPHIQT